MNILIAGLGSIGKKHVDAIIDLEPNSKLFAVRSKQNADTYKTVFNVNFREVLLKKIDFVIISNVTNVHAKTIKEMLQLKCPLFIEKPVLDSLTEGSELSKAIEANGVLTYVACNLRFHPALVFIKNYLDQKKPRINEVNIYCGSYLPDWRTERDFKKVYSANKEMGGGVHLDLIHEIDYCSWLFGFPQSIYANKRADSSLNITAYDYTNFILHYPDYNASIILNYYRRDAKRSLEILTSEETLLVDLINNTITNKTSGEILFQSEMKIIDTYREQMKYFLNKIRKNEQPMNGFDNALKVLEIAVYE